MQGREGVKPSRQFQLLNAYYKYILVFWVVVMAIGGWRVSHFFGGLQVWPHAVSLLLPPRIWHGPRCPYGVLAPEPPPPSITASRLSCCVCRTLCLSLLLWWDP
jgi:hypothetical protein